MASQTSQLLELFSWPTHSSDGNDPWPQKTPIGGAHLSEYPHSPFSTCIKLNLSLSNMGG